MDENNAVSTPSTNAGGTSVAPQAETTTTQEVTQTPETQTVDQTASVQTEQLKEESHIDKQTGNRTQRRIQKLLEQKQEQAKATTQSDVYGQNLPPWMQPQVQPDENGNIDPNQFMEVAKANARQEALQIVAEERARQQQREVVMAHSAELQALAEKPEFKSEAFEEAFSTMYNDINSDDKGNFVPKRKPSEVYESLKRAFTVGQNRGVADTTNNVQEIINNMAVQPTQVAPTTEPTDEQMQDMVRKDPDAVIKHYQRKFGTN